MTGERRSMYWPVPAEMINAAVQLVVCFFTVVAALLGFVLTARA